METAIIGGLIALLNIFILFELNRMNSEITAFRMVADRVTKLEAQVHSCPECRSSMEG